MIRRKGIFLVICSGLIVPLLTYVSPGWLAISGIAPSWGILWLMPWALEAGPWAGVIAGLCLALALDSLTIGLPSHLPSLVLLGFIWGRLGSRITPIQGSLNFGFIALLGTFLSGLIFWLQVSLYQKDAINSLVNAWSIHTILAETIMTALIAPIISTWLLAFFKTCRN